MPGCPQWDPRVPGITGFPARTLHSVRMRLSATGGLPGALGRRGWNRAVPGQPPEAHPPGPVLGLHGTGGRPPRGGPQAPCWLRSGGALMEAQHPGPLTTHRPVPCRCHSEHEFKRPLVWRTRGRPADPGEAPLTVH